VLEINNISSNKLIREAVKRFANTLPSPHMANALSKGLAKSLQNQTVKNFKIFLSPLDLKISSAS
jgi:hypothetical protein